MGDKRRKMESVQLCTDMKRIYFYFTRSVVQYVKDDERNEKPVAGDDIEKSCIHTLGIKFMFRFLAFLA